MTGLEGLVMLLRWRRVDIRGYTQESAKWFQWGYIWKGDLDRFGLEQPRFWYILIRLPFYFMAPRMWLDDDQPVWHQRCLLFKERVPAGEGGWQETEMVCER